ncbi:MAG: SpoIIE family protein phosphatase [Treponema sp.]|nr:SpoIIE family protein phosphatase [Treponema sp.]
MIFLILSFLSIGLFLFFTLRIDKKAKSGNYQVNSIVVALLITTIEAFLYFIALCFNQMIATLLVKQIMRLVFVLEGMSLIYFSFGITELVVQKKSKFVTFIKILLIAFLIYIVYFQFTSIDISLENGTMIGSSYLFPVAAREYFPWNWVTLYNSIFKYIVPIAGILFMIIYQENNASQLERYQSGITILGIILMWCLNALIKFLSMANPAFTLIHMYSYVIMYVCFFSAMDKTTVPSGKGFWVNVFKSFISYVIPAFLLGSLFYYLQPVGSGYNWLFLLEILVAAVVCIVFSLKIRDVISSSRHIYTADYEESLEKDLASIDYNDEMDSVTNKMFDIMKKNVESSSMNVYIINKQNEFETAYTSNKMNLSIPQSNPIFNHLLMENRSIVLYIEIEKEHIFAPIKNDLKKFFEDTASDALFVLNEGNNILGLITLGKKQGGDHYKEYDYNVFTKLYSYFFVFGYYMRNISNKDIIGTVNREIRMSSQIITSIQENIDVIKNPKIDVGYKMVPAHNIGGEFIDMIRLTDTRHLIVIGDLSGKGIAASMNMVILKSIIRTYLVETTDFKQLVIKVNSFVRDSLRKGTIFAGLFALLDFENDTMYYINCGIPAFFMFNQVYNNVIEIQGGGHVLGFVKDISPYLSVKTTKMMKDDIFLTCTDGLIQSHSLRGEQFGKERVQQSLLDNQTYNAQRMAQFTFDNLTKFMSKEMEDDVSIFVIKYQSDNSSEAKEKNIVENDEIIEGNEAIEVTDSSINSSDTAIADEMVNDSTVEDVSNETTDFSEKDNLEEKDELIKSEDLSEETKSEKETEESVKDDISEDDFEMPDLSGLDDIIKNAGL